MTATSFQIAVLAWAALATMAMPAAAIDLTFTDETGMSATIYGQINPTFQSVDDGVASYDDFVDNGNSVSRIGVRIVKPLGEDELFFNFESALGITNTAVTSQTDDAPWIDWRRADIRKLEFAYTAGFGKVWIGQGSMATDGAAEVDNSGTSVVGYVNLADTAGAYQFRAGTMLSGIRISDAFKDFDGGRRGRVRYDTPSLAGFTLSAAYGQEMLNTSDSADYYDTALRYSFGNDHVGIDTAVGYSWKDDMGVTTEQVIGSGTIIHKPTGLNLTLAAGRNRSDDSSYYYAKLGWKGDLFEFGATAVSVDFYNGSDFMMPGSSSRSWGVQAVQSLDDLKLEAYAGYRVYSFDDNSGAGYEDLDALLVGGRWRF